MEVKSIGIPAKTIRVRMLQMRLSARPDPVASCYRAGCPNPVIRWGRKEPRVFETSVGEVHACGDHAIPIMGWRRFQ